MLVWADEGASTNMKDVSFFLKKKKKKKKIYLWWTMISEQKGEAFFLLSQVPLNKHRPCTSKYYYCIKFPGCMDPEKQG